MAHLLPTKLAPPQSPSRLVPRGAVTRRLEEAARRRLVVIAAPLGSGKTTLLAQWVAHRGAQGGTASAVAWLSLDEQDNAPDRCFAYLAGAIRRAVPQFDASIAGPLDEQVELPIDHVTSVVLQGLWELDRELCVVLDDFHVLRDPGLVRAFAYLVEHSPPRVHWVIAARQPPQLELARLKLVDQLEMLDARDLRFDSEAIRLLGERLCGVALPAEDVEYLRERTEGWVAGLKLALLSAGEHARAKDALRSAGGSNRDVASYLADALLREQPQEVHDFLLVSSILERLHGDLCNALLGIRNAPVLLAALERAQLFIQPLDNEGRWYRYHALFHEFLRDRLQRERGDAIPSLHRTASGWFAEHGMADEALAHAFESGDRAWCLELTARCVDAWMREGEVARVLQWTAKLTLDEIARSPAICVAHVASLTLSRRFVQAATVLRALQQQLAASPRPQLEPLGRKLEELALLLAILSDAPGGAMVELESATRDDDPDVFMAGAVLAARAYRALRMNRFDAMRRLALIARERLEGRNSPFLVGYSDMLIALADRAQGDFRSATERCEQAFARASAGPRNPVWVNAATALANTRYEQNRLDEAEGLLGEVLPLLAQAPAFETFALAYLTLARLKAVRGRSAEAYQLLDYLHSVLECSHQTRFLAQVCGEKVRLAILDDTPARMKAVAKEFQLGERMRRGEWSARRFYDETWERLGLAQAWVLITRGRFGKARAVLETLRASAHDVGYVYRETTLSAALAACHWRAGDAAAAYNAVNRGLALVQRYGFSRSVFDETPGLQDIVVAAARDRKLTHGLSARYAERFQDLLAAGVPGAAGGRNTGPREPLTDRELEMLKLLAEGLSNQEISERTNVALSTTKWHLRNVFAKLEVTTRTAAIVKAHEIRRGG